MLTGGKKGGGRALLQGAGALDAEKTRYKAFSVDN